MTNNAHFGKLSFVPFRQIGKKAKKTLDKCMAVVVIYSSAQESDHIEEASQEKILRKIKNNVKYYIIFKRLNQFIICIKFCKKKTKKLLTQNIFRFKIPIDGKGIYCVLRTQ